MKRNSNHSAIKGHVKKMKLTRLKSLRTKRGLTWQDLADRAGIGMRSVARYESGESFPTLETLITLAKVLECSLDDLLDLPGRKPNPQEILSPDEKRLLDAYRHQQLTDDEWRLLKAFRTNNPALAADLLTGFLARLSEQLKNREDVTRGDNPANG